MSEEIRAAIIEANAEITQDINEKNNIKAFLNFLADTPQGKEFDKAVIRNAEMLSKVTGCTPLSEIALMYFVKSSHKSALMLRVMPCQST